MSQNFQDPKAQPFDLAGGDAALLLIHGFTGSPGHMRLIGDAAHAAGFSVRGIQLPGHGTTVQDMAASSGEQWWAACRDAYLDMKSKYRRVSVGGLSLGGVLTLRLAQAYDPDCVLLFAPALKYKSAINHLSTVAKHFVPYLKWGERDEDPETFRYDYDFGYELTPVARVQDMTCLQRAARADLQKVTCPTLVFQSHRDQSVHRDVPETIAGGIGSMVKEIAWVDRSPHVLTIGADREYVCQRVIDFLRRYGV